MMSSYSVGLLALLVVACRVRSSEPTKPSSSPPPALQTSAAPSAAPEPSGSLEQPPPEPAAGTLALVAVCGIGSDPRQVESASAALRLSRLAHEAGASCLDAVVAGVAALEDDPLLNAGRGAALRLDGSAELDAAVMTSAGQFGAVTGLASVQNPSRVARAVLDTPHRVLAGAGAQRLARLLGLEAFDVRTEAAKIQHRSLLSELAAVGGREAQAGVTDWSSVAAGGAPGLLQAFLPKTSTPARGETKDQGSVPSAAEAPSVASPPGATLSDVAGAAAASSAPPAVPASAGGDTVAVLARCDRGEFAAAVSGGGPWLSLPGRIGDVPVPGAALYVGPKAAVFASGHGEAILDKLLARATYERLVSAGSADAALSWALKQAAPGQLTLVIAHETGVVLGPEGASAWAMLGPTLRTSKDGR